MPMMQSALRGKGRSNNIDLALLAYWGILVFWQNINPGSTGSTADTLIKTGLIVFLAGYYILHAEPFGRRSVLLMLAFALSMSLSFVAESTFSLRMLLTYFFPVAFAFCAFCPGGNFQINKKRLLRFMYAIILIVLYMALYALIATPQKFFSALSASSAYGNELTSFFASNHEYGLYLMAGIVACLVCIEMDGQKGFWKKLLFFVAIPLFLANLVLTYSRTAMLATVLIFAACVFLNHKSRFAKLLLIGFIVVAAVVAAVPALHEYFLKIVLKDNNLAGRDELASLAMDTFKNGAFFEKIWGQGASATASFFREETDHASVHNAYLQVLLYFGISGLFAMVSVLLLQLRGAFWLIKRDRFLGVIQIGLVFACASMMLTNTAVLFSSPIDSYFLTMFTIVVPRYVGNAVQMGEFN